MHVVMMALWLGCAHAADGQIWLSLKVVEEDSRVSLTVPADWLQLESEPVEVELRNGSQVDLRDVAKDLSRQRVGSKRSLKVKNGTLIVSNRSSRRFGEIEAISLAILGPRGNGLTLDFPLEPDQLTDAGKQLDAALDLDGVALELDEHVCRQLREAPPTVLLEAVGPDGNTVRIATHD